MEGLSIGQYRVLKKLGEGGMGAVYIAEHVLLGRKAAIKVLLPQLSAHQEIVNRFFNEARAATAISDPGIVQIFDFGYHTDGSAFIVMEFLEGETLDSRLRRLGRLHPADAIRLIRQVASSLAAAHARGIIHRDLKPENIFLVVDKEVSGGERAKILDFGIAKLSDDHPGKVRTHTQAIMGTPMYMSPEQCRGAGQVDARSDVYALGCVLFHLLTGTVPFDGEGAGDIIAAHLREPAPAPSSRAPGIAPEVDGVVLRCMAKTADQRFASMEELATVLGQLAGFVTTPPGPGYTGPLTPPPGAHVAASPTTLSSVASQVSVSSDAVPPRRTGLIVALAVGGLAIGGVAAFFATSGSQGTPAKAPDAAPAAIAPPVDAAPAATTPIDAAPIDAGVAPDAATIIDAGAPDARKRRHGKEPKGDGTPCNNGVVGDTDCDGIPDDRLN
jgi:serine/threonine-protein kinase